MISRSRYVCANSARTVRPIIRSSSRAGMITETRGNARGIRGRSRGTRIRLTIVRSRASSQKARTMYERARTARQTTLSGAPRRFQRVRRVRKLGADAAIRLARFDVVALDLVRVGEEEQQRV